MNCIYKKTIWYDEDENEIICTNCDSEFYGEYPYSCETCKLCKEVNVEGLSRLDERTEIEITLMEGRK